MKIAIVGSAQDHGYSSKMIELAETLGREIAGRGHTLLYGPELRMPSLSYHSAKAAIGAGGVTVGYSIGAARAQYFDSSAATVTVYTDGGSGGIREVVLVNSADGVISIGGGGGTLLEIAAAYMNFIPVVAMKGTGGWSEKLIGTYIDDRKKFIIPGAETAAEAVDLIEKMYDEYRHAGSQSSNLAPKSGNS